MQWDHPIKENMCLKEMCRINRSESLELNFFRVNLPWSAMRKMSDQKSDRSHFELLEHWCKWVSKTTMPNDRQQDVDHFDIVNTKTSFTVAWNFWLTNGSKMSRSDWPAWSDHFWSRSHNLIQVISKKKSIFSQTSGTRYFLYFSF